MRISKSKLELKWEEVSFLILGVSIEADNGKEETKDPGLKHKIYNTKTMPETCIFFKVPPVI